MQLGILERSILSDDLIIYLWRCAISSARFMQLDGESLWFNRPLMDLTAGRSSHGPEMLCNRAGVPPLRGGI